MKDIMKILPAPVKKVVMAGVGFAELNNYRIYIVGGAVRDYFMSIKPIDVDVVIEGNGLKIAELISAKFGLPLVRHERFITATIKIDGYEVDFSTARKEVYKKPAALPDVVPATIEEDLQRRDFTINAIAISLNKKDYLKVIDPFNGLIDIQNKIIRVLHDKSFVDDPTRVFRAIRYMSRFGFNIEQHTEQLIFKALKDNTFGGLTSSRIFNEFKLLFSEKEPGICLKNLRKYHLVQTFSESIKVSEKLLNIFYRIPEINNKLGITEQWRVCILALLRGLSPEERKLIIQKYPFDRHLIDSLNQIEEFHRVCRSLNRKIDNSKLFMTLRDFKDDIIIYGIASTESSLIALNLKRFIKLRKCRAVLSGHDLKKLGIPEGPHYNRILREVHLLYLDGKLKNKKDAERWVKIKLTPPHC